MYLQKLNHYVSVRISIKRQEEQPTKKIITVTCKTTRGFPRERERETKGYLSLRAKIRDQWYIKLRNNVMILTARYGTWIPYWEVWNFLVGFVLTWALQPLFEVWLSRALYQLVEVAISPKGESLCIFPNINQKAIRATNTTTTQKKKSNVTQLEGSLHTHTDYRVFTLKGTNERSSDI